MGMGISTIAFNGEVEDGVIAFYEDGSSVPEKMPHYLENRKCASTSCTSYERVEHLRLFRFPRDKARYQLWADVANNPKLDRETLSKAFLCSRHFLGTQFRDAERTQLIYGSVPTTDPISPNRNLSLLPPPKHLSPPAATVECSGMSTGMTVDESVTPSFSPLDFLKTSTPKPSCSIRLFPPITDPIPSTSTASSMSLEPLPDIFDHSTSFRSKKTKSLLSKINLTRISQLTPKKSVLYKHAKQTTIALRKLREKFRKNTLALKEVCNMYSQPARLVATLAESMSLPSAHFLAAQVRCSKRQPKGRRYTNAEKLLALSIFKRSRKCYALLRAMFALPSPRTLITLLNRVPFETGINSHIFSSLEKSLTGMDESDRTCSLMFDEMSIRKHVQYDCKCDRILGYEDLGDLGRTGQFANHALVFMARGLKRKWRQPLAFYFCSGGMKSDILCQILMTVLRACQGIGLRVASLVCDMGSNNVKTLKLLGVSKEKPFFTIDGQEVVVIYDPPHLLKCTRNMLYKHNVLVNVKVGGNVVGLTAKWDHIRTTYANDKAQAGYQVLYKLTDSHLDPVGPITMRVGIAAQTMSHTVAGMVCNNVSNKHLGTDGLATAEMVGMTNRTFDSVNGSSAAPQKAGGLNCQVRIEREGLHLRHWAKAAKAIDEWQVLTGKQTGPQVFRPPSQDGWLVTLRGVTRLWKKLKNEGFTYLATRLLNQDPIEHLFGSVRAQCGSNYNPTVSQFVSALKACIVNGLAFRDLTGTNCEEESDPGTLLNNLQEFLNADSERFSSSVQLNPDAGYEEREVTPYEYTEETFSLKYVTGFIARRILSDGNCNNCRACLVTPETEVLKDINMCFKEYSETCTGLTYPTEVFVTTVGAGATTLEHMLDDLAHLDGVKLRVVDAIKRKTDFRWLEEGCPVHYLCVRDKIIEGICCISIPWWCKRKNRSFAKGRKTCGTRKMKILTNQ